MISDLKSCPLQNQSHVIQNSEFLTNFPDRFSQLLSLLAGPSLPFMLTTRSPNTTLFFPVWLLTSGYFWSHWFTANLGDWAGQYFFFFFFLAMAHGLWNLSSLTRDWTLSMESESPESWSLGHQGILEQVRVWMEDCDGKCPRGPLPKPPVYVCIWVPCSVAQSCLTLYDSPDCGPPGCPGGFSRQEYWSGVPFPPPGTLLTQGSLAPPALLGVFFTTEPPGKPHLCTAPPHHTRTSLCDRQDSTEITACHFWAWTTKDNCGSFFWPPFLSLSNGQLWGKPAASPRAAIWKAPRGEDLRPSSGNQRRELGRRPSCRGPKCWPQAWLKPRGRPGARSRHLRCSQTLREVTDSSCLKPLHFLAICSAALMHANRHCRAVVFVCFSSDL